MPSYRRNVLATSTLPRVILTGLAIAVLHATTPRSIASPLLAAGDGKADRVVLVPSKIDLSSLPTTPMLARVQGAEIIQGAALDRLRKAFRAPTREDGTFDASLPQGFLQAQSADRRTSTWYEIRVSTHASVFLKSERAAPMVLDAAADPHSALRIAGLRAVPGTPSKELHAGATIECTPRAGTLRIDHALLEHRLFTGTLNTGVGTERDLTTGRAAIRLPAHVDQENYPGVLLWINGSDDNTLPEQLFAAADQYGLVLATQVDAGNGTAVPARLQRVCDTLATVCEKVHIDLSRVYVGGISGGGKSATLLAVGFPEIIAGVLPVVGFGTYESTTSPDYLGQWPPLFTKPRGPHLTLLTSLRFAPITGDKDFNHAPILASTKVFERDKFQLRLFDVPGLGHEMPSPETLQKAIGWLDEPSMQGRKARNERAGALLTAQGQGRHDALVQATELAPYSASAWTALRELQAEKGGR